MTALHPGVRRDDSDAGVAVGVHETQGNDAVEPAVSDSVRDGSPALSPPPAALTALSRAATTFGSSTRSGDADASTTATRASPRRMSAVRAQVAKDFSGAVSIRVRFAFRRSELEQRIAKSGNVAIDILVVVKDTGDADTVCS